MTTEEHPTVENQRTESRAGDMPARACRKCSAISQTDTAACPECGAAFTARDWRGIVIRVAAVTAVVIPLLIGAYFIGQSTRMSGGDVDHKLAGQSNADRNFYKTRTQAALRHQEKKLRRVFDKRAKKRAEKAFKRGQNSGYASGQSVGYSSGKSAGQTEGFDAGFDWGACLTDIDYC